MKENHHLKELYAAVIDLQRMQEVTIVWLMTIAIAQSPQAAKELKELLEPLKASRAKLASLKEQL